MSSFIDDLRTRAWWKNALSLLFAVLLVANILTVYFLSAENSSESSSRSEGIADVIAGVIVDGYHEMESAEQQEYVNKIHSPLRSAAHFSLFACIGMLSTLLIYSLNIRKWHFTIAIPLVFGLLNAVFDELHQLSSEGRACDIVDICVDFSGVCLAVLTVNLVARLITVNRKRKASRAAS